MHSIKVVCICVMWLLPKLSDAQCVIDIAQGDTVQINCGDSLLLSTPNGSNATYFDNFNAGSIDSNLWLALSPIDYGTPCDTTAPVGGNYAWMGVSTTIPRFMNTVPLDVSCGGTICFDLKMGTQGDLAPCEGPELSTEGVSLEYSTGFVWVQIFYFDHNQVCCGCPSTGCAGLGGPYLDWNTYCFPIPAAAMTPSTQFRWIQSNGSTNNFDCWGIDEVEITLTCNNVSVLWSTQDTIDTAIVQGITSDTTFWIQKITGTDTCSDTIQVLVDQIDFDATTSVNTFCAGAVVQFEMDTANAQGLSQGVNYTYDWAPSTGLTTPNEPSTDASITSSGTVVASITHPLYSSCTASDTVAVTVQNPLVINSAQVTAEHCGTSLGGIADGSISLTVSGGTGAYVYDYGNGFTASASNNTLTAQSYTITVLDTLSNCSIDTLLIVPLDPGLVLDSIQYQMVSCSSICDGTAEAFASGASGNINYLWSWSAAATALDTGLCADSGTLFVQDAFCSLLVPVVVTQPTVLSVLPVTLSNATCQNSANGTAEVIGAGGLPPYTYFWPQINASGALQNALVPGTYNVVVTDQNGCTASEDLVVGSDNPTPVVTLPNDTTLCAGDTLFVNAGSFAGVNYLWSNNATTQTTEYTAAGAHWINVSSSAGCTGSDTLVLQYYAPPLAIDLGADTIITNGDSLVLDAGSGFQFYVWLADSSIGQLDTITQTGIYAVVAADSNGCRSSDTINVTIFPTGIQERGTLAGAQVFPNPSQGQFTFQALGTAGKELEFQLLSINGKVVHTETKRLSENGLLDFDLTELSPGVYLLNVRDGETQASFQLLISND